jgi:hypothetical protein
MQPENNSDLFNDLSFDLTAKQHIRSIASWAIVIGVVGLIALLITLIQTFTAPAPVSSNSEGFDFNNALRMGNSSGVWEVIGGLIRLVLIFFLFRFASQARTGLNGLDQSSLNGSFNSLKLYFMMGAIICLLFFLFFVLAMVFAVSAKSF